MHKKNLLTILVIGVAILIFIGWLFSLKYSLSSRESRDKLINIFEETLSQINKSFHQAGEEFKDLPASFHESKEAGPKENEKAGEEPLSEEELQRLKEKIKNATEEKSTK